MQLLLQLQSQPLSQILSSECADEFRTGLGLATLIALGAIAIYLLVKHLLGSQNVDIAPLGDSLIDNNEALALILRDDTDDVKSGFIPLHKLETYLAYIKERTDQTTFTLSGIEVFFAKYDEVNQFDHYRMFNENSRTFVIYPTVDLGDIDGSRESLSGLNTHAAFDPIASLGETDPVLISDISIGDNNGNNLIALNRAHMSPPRGN